MRILMNSVYAISLVVSALLVSGCSKQETTPPATQGQSPTESAITDAQKRVGDAAAQAKDAAQKTAAEVQKQATEVGAAAQAKAQEVIDQAKKLVSENKFTDALSLLQQKLAGLQLTPEQQKLVDSLKEQIQKAIASSATKGAEGLKKALGN